MHNLKTFIDNVRQMRHLQTEYFRTREGKTLRLAKEAERRVDADLEYYEREHRPKENPKLF